MAQTSLLQQLRQENDPAAARNIALELLDTTKRREMIDAALRVLEQSALDDDARPVLRNKTFYYFDQNQHDTGALLREKLMRMLMDIAHPDDRDIYLRGLETYEVQPLMGEVTQNLRAIALIALAVNDPDLAHVYAVKLLSELESTSKFNSEPAVTAINLLHQHGKTLPIYEFLLLGGTESLEIGHHEVVGKALESLGGGFPTPLYRTLIDLFAERDRAVVNMGIVTHIVENRVRELYPTLDEIITQTRHDELHNYGVVMLAVSRDDELIDRLYALAKLSPERRLANFIEAIELVPGDEKNELLESLRGRMG